MGHLKKGNLEMRQESAKARVLERKKLTATEIIAGLDKKYGKGLGAKKERERLARKPETPKEAPKVEAKKEAPKSPKEKFAKRYSKVAPKEAEKSK